MTPADVSALVELMVKHGCTRIVAGDVTIERPIPIPRDTRAEQAASDWDRIKQMPEDKQEAALMLRRIGRGG